MSTRPKRSNDPIRISDTAWYYEEPGRITVVVECREPDGTFHRTLTVHLAISKLQRSLDSYPRRRRT